MAVVPSNTTILKGQKFHRIKTRAVDSGDLFRVQSSAQAIVVGPESDFSEYFAYYYDPVQPGLISKLRLSTDQPFIGQLNATLADNYPTQPQNNVLTPIPGEIIIVPGELYNPEALKFLAQGPFLNGIEANYIPQIDLLFYFDEPAAIPDKRPPLKIRNAIQTAAAGAAPSIVSIPVYGRRSMSMSVYQTDVTVNPVSVEIIGIKFTWPLFDFNSAQQVLITTLTAIVQGEGVNSSWNEDAIFNDGVSPIGGKDIPVGRFDYIVARLPNTENDPSQTPSGQIQFIAEAFD